MKYSLEQNPECFDNIIVCLNGKRIPFPLECDTNEGWVEVLDEEYIAKLAPCTDKQSIVEEDDTPTVIDNLAVKRLYGIVTLIPVQSGS